MKRLPAFSVRSILTWLAMAMAALALLGAGGCGSDEESSAETARKTAAATELYRDYLLVSAEKLTTWSSQLRSKIKRGIIPGAMSRYASSLVPFGHLTPALSFYPKLDKRLDAPQTGTYPRLERMLWQEDDGAATLKAAGEIFYWIPWFHEEIKTTKLPPAAVVASAQRALNSIATSDLKLEATPYAGIDMLVASANLEGVEAAFKAVRPAVLAEDPDLAESLNKEFSAAFAELEEFGVPAKKLKQIRPNSPGTSFIASSELTPEELRPLTESVDRIQAYFDRLSATLADT